MSDDDSTWVRAQHVDTLEVQMMQRSMVRPGSGWREITDHDRKEHAQA